MNRALRRPALLRAAALGVVAAAVSATAALAAGSPSIASAPFVQLGAPQAGDTACCREGQTRYPWLEFWKLGLIAGDRVRLEYTYAGDADEDVTPFVYPPSVNDFNFDEDADLDANLEEGTGNRGQLTFVAARSGDYPLAFATFYVRDPTSYEFTAYVRHVARLALAPLRSVKRRGMIRVLVRRPDGVPLDDQGLRLTLLGRWDRRWRTIASALPDKGAATFRLKLPATLRGQTIQLKVRASGGSYAASTSATRKAAVR